MFLVLFVCILYFVSGGFTFPQEMGLMEVELMWRLLMSEPETACLTCPVRPVNPFESLLASSQYLERETENPPTVLIIPRIVPLGDANVPCL